MSGEETQVDSAAQLRERVRGLEAVPPIELEQRLLELGYKGQERARQALALACYRHLRRLRELYLDGTAPARLGPRQNLLLIGPTGCGKSFLVETLFREIAKVPTAVVDATTLTEVGYVGSEVAEIPGRLIDAAGGDVAWAQAGMILLDEVDKLAGARSNARFAGEGTTKDVSGYGVQRGLLALLSSGASAYAPSYRAKPIVFDLSAITFVACGAFSGVRPSREAIRKPAGFGGGRDDSPSAEPSAIAPAEIERFGFLPELIGRFTRIIEFEPLSALTLRAILSDDLIGSYQKEFAREGVELRVDEGALDQVVADAVQRGHGARGLNACLAAALEDSAFRCFGLRREGAVVLRASQGRLVAEYSEERARALTA